MTHYDPASVWNKRAPSYDPPPAGDLGANLLAWLDEYYQRGETMLEVGSGNGRICKLVTGHIPTVHYEMCDISLMLAQRCRVATGRAVTVYDVADGLPFEAGAFDWLISFSMLLHVPPESIAQTLTEFARVSAGWVFASTFVDGGTGNVGADCFRHDYEALFSECGLAICEMWHCGSERQRQWLLRRA